MFGFPTNVSLCPVSYFLFKVMIIIIILMFIDQAESMKTYTKIEYKIKKEKRKVGITKAYLLSQPHLILRTFQ